jgi:hypothetical protein
MSGSEDKLPGSIDYGEALRYEEFVAKLLKLRKQDPEKPAWERFLNSAGIVALVTVLGTAALGAWIAGAIQDRSKQHELRYLSYDKNLTALLDVVKNGFLLAGQRMATSANLIDITKPEFKSSANGQNHQAIDNQKKSVAESYNQGEADWSKAASSVGYLLAWYVPDQGDLREQWKTVEDSIDKFASCAGEIYKKNLRNPDATGTCKSEEDIAEKELTTMSRQLASAKEKLMRAAEATSDGK